MACSMVFSGVLSFLVVLFGHRLFNLTGKLLGMVYQPAFWRLTCWVLRSWEILGPSNFQKLLGSQLAASYLFKFNFISSGISSIICK